MFQIGLIGAGRWGPNVARSFEETGEAEIRWICDPDETRRAAVPSRARRTARLDEVLGDPAVDAVAIATPAGTHYRLARRALMAGKHVLVEKPFTTSAADAVELIGLADRLRRVAFVGHVYEYNSTLSAVKELIGSGELGHVRHIRCERRNFGPVRDDVNALWDLGAHDISMLCLLMNGPPATVAAAGEACLRPGIEDVVSATFGFSGGISAHGHVSWLHPVKVRRMTVVGSRRVLLWDELDAAAPVRVVDRHAVAGGVRLPAVARNVPLRAEVSQFLRCLKSPGTPYSDGRAGLRVVQALEAASASLRAGGRQMVIDSSIVADAMEERPQYRDVAD